MVGMGITAGQQLVKTLNEDLPNGFEWDRSELAILSLIEESADRVAVLKTLLADQVAAKDVNKVVDLSAEIRLVQATIAKMIAALDPRMENVAKSVQHQDAARARWHRGGA